MKKTRFIVLALVVAFALSGIAFAAWTDMTLFNVSAQTGEFKIEIADEDCVCSDGVQGIFYYGSNAMVDEDNDYDGEEACPDFDQVFGSGFCNVVTEVADVNTLTITAENLFPGVYAAFGCQIMNNGTVPAALDSVGITYDSMSAEDEEEASHLWVELQFMVYDNDTRNCTNCHPDESDCVAVGEPIACFLYELPGKMVEALGDFRLDPSNVLFARTYHHGGGGHGGGDDDDCNLDEITQVYNNARIGMNEDVYAWENTVTEKNTYTFSIKYNWKQWNMPQMDSTF